MLLGHGLTLRDGAIVYVTIEQFEVVRTCQEQQPSEFSLMHGSYVVVMQLMATIHA